NPQVTVERADVEEGPRSDDGVVLCLGGREEVGDRRLALVHQLVIVGAGVVERLAVEPELAVLRRDELGSRTALGGAECEADRGEDDYCDEGDQAVAALGELALL